MTKEQLRTFNCKQNEVRTITIIEGPLVSKTKASAQTYLLKIAKRNIEQGKYKPKQDAI